VLVGGDEDVVRLDVPVDDPVAVREAKGLEQLLGVADRRADRERAAGHDQLLEAAPLDHLHGDVVRALGLAAVVDGDDVRMGEARRRLRLAPEALDEEVVVRVAVVEDLDRDAAAELLVLGQVDVRHAPGAQLPEDPVPAVEERVYERVGGTGHCGISRG
jgi:GAF domain-containing protein